MSTGPFQLGFLLAPDDHRQSVNILGSDWSAHASTTSNLVNNRSGNIFMHIIIMKTFMYCG